MDTPSGKGRGRMKFLLAGLLLATVSCSNVPQQASQTKPVHYPVTILVGDTLPDRCWGNDVLIRKFDRMMFLCDTQTGHFKSTGKIYLSVAH